MRRKRLPIGGLEDAIMDVLWTEDAWLTPRDVLATSPSTRGLAYSTITTVLVRLFKKGRLKRRREGRAFVYRPTMSRAEWAAGCMDDALALVGDRGETLTHFVDMLDDADRKELRRKLNRGRR